MLLRASLALCLALFVNQADASVIATVSTLDGVTGNPIPGSGDTDMGATSAMASSSGTAGASSYSGTAQGDFTSFFSGNKRFTSYQFKLYSQAINPVGMGGGPEAFEVGADVNFSDIITGASGPVFLPEDLELVFIIDGNLNVNDPTMGGGTVAQDFDINANDGNGGFGNAAFRVTNQDGGLLEIMDNGAGITNYFSQFMTDTGNFRVETTITVKKNTPFNINFRSLSVLGADGSATGDLMSTISLVDVTDVGGTTSFSDVVFGSGTTFSSSPVPEPSGVILLGIASLGSILCYRRKRLVS